MSSFWRDFRFGIRNLRKNKGFAFIAILVLALGIGPNTAIFSVIYAALLEPPSWGHAEQVVILRTIIRGHDSGGNSIPDYLEWTREANAFSDMQGALPTSFSIAEGEEPKFVQGTNATPGMWRLFGQKMALGRDLLPEDAEPGKTHVALLGNRLWTTQFGSDPHIVGKTVHMNGEPYTVLGIRGKGPSDRDWNQVTVPLSFTPQQRADRQHRPLIVVARLKPAVSLEAAQSQMRVIAGRLANEYPDSNKNAGITVERFWNDFLPQKTRTNLYLLMGAVSLVLLIACANVANLLLARGVARQKEFALRVPLGASKWQVCRQLLIEAITLSFAGALFGIALAAFILKALIALMPEDTLSIEAELRLSFPVLLFTLGSTVLAGVIFGMIPAWSVVRGDLNQALGQVARSVTGARRWTQRTLVVAEFALALTLLASAGLTIHSFWKISSLDLGVRTDHVLTFYLPIKENRFATTAQSAEFYKSVLNKLQSVPGIQSSAISTGLPLTGSQFATDFTIAGQEVGNAANAPTSGLALVTPGFFETYGIRLAMGRSFTEQDGPESVRVALVNDSFARRYLKGRDPLKEQIVMQRPTLEGKGQQSKNAWQIVGVYHGVKNLWGLDRQDRPEICLPFWQSAFSGGVIAVRTGADIAAMQNSISRAVHSIASELPLAELRTLDQVRDSGMAGERFTTTLFSAFAGLALLLAAAGIYGVMTYSVSQRTREIGLRAALGAARGDVLWLIMREGMQLALAGLILGLSGAYLVSSLMRSMLFGMERIDFQALVAVALVLLASAVTACYVPAWRATRIDPMVALRQE